MVLTDQSQRPFRCILRQLRGDQQVTSNPKTSMSEMDFRDSVYNPYWGPEAAGDASGAWPLFVGVLISYNALELRAGTPVDWAFVKGEVAAKSRRGPFIPSWRSAKECTELYDEHVHALVLAWLDEVELHTILTSDQATALDRRFATLYRPDVGGFVYVFRNVDDDDFHTLLQLLSLTQLQAGEDRHHELESCRRKAGTFQWVLHIAESPVLRRAVRDLPPRAAQYLLLVVQNALTSTYPGNAMLIKLLQDVSHYCGSFPYYLCVRNVQQTLLGGPMARGDEGSIQKVMMGSERVVVKTPRYGSSGDPSKYDVWNNRQTQVRALLLWSQLIRMGVDSVVPLLGVYVDESKPLDLQLCPVMPECIPISQWLASVDIISRYRAFACLLMGIANALRSLHEHNVVHGDLHSGNILLEPTSLEDDKPTVLLCDFGMMRLRHGSGPNSTSVEPRSSLRKPFAAPELLKLHEQGAEIKPDRPIDVYAFGKTIYTLLTGNEPPAGELGNDPPNDLAAIIGGRKAHALWAVVKLMTAEDPQRRPSMVDSSPGAGDGVMNDLIKILANFV